MYLPRRYWKFSTDKIYIRTFCEQQFAVKWGYLELNPMAEKRVELPRGSTKRSKRPVQLTAAQFLYLLPQYEIREQVAVALVGWLGPRRSEAFGLQWQDLNTESRVVRFCRG